MSDDNHERLTLERHCEQLAERNDRLVAAYHDAAARTTELRERNAELVALLKEVIGVDDFGGLRALMEWRLRKQIEECLQQSTEKP